MVELSIGRGALEATVATRSGESWIVFGGQTSFAASGARDILRRFVDESAGFRTVRGPVPTLKEIDELAESVRGTKVSGVLAVGGGLVIDTAKAVKLSLESASRVGDLLGSTAPKGGTGTIEMVAVPTTAGSGAERTPFAVVYRNGTKHSLEDDRMVPDTAVIDPLLTRSAPRSVAAAAGLDALAHCVESLWAVRSTDDSRSIASEALSLVRDNIEPAVLKNEDDAQEAMALAASQAGAAIAVTRTTAAHALSYHLTSRYGVAHGHAVALTLGALLEHNERVDETNCRDPRGVAHVKGVVREVCRVLKVGDGQEARNYLSWLVDRLTLAPSVEEAIPGTVDRRAWACDVNPERLSNNPMTLDESELIDIVESV